MKIKTSELTGAALDWAVARCEGGVGKNQLLGAWYAPSTDWGQGGPIIEREGITLDYDHYGPSRLWIASIVCEDKEFDGVVRFECNGPTALTAAMRCRVASKLGDTVDIPEELTK